MKKLIFLVSIIVIAASSVRSQTVITDYDLNTKVNKILLKRELNGFAEELARTKGSRVDDLLVRLYVFDRIGQNERVRQTVVQLSEAIDLPPISERELILGIVRQKIQQDLTAQRIYYDLLVEDDGYYSTNPFIKLWQSEGNEEELEAWLTKRAIIGNSWFTILLERRLRLGTIQPLFDELAGNVRQNPTDKKTRSNYLWAVLHAQGQSLNKNEKPFENETNWLTTILHPQSASDAYEFGLELDAVNPLLAIKYYLEALSKPLTSKEIEILSQKHRIMVSYGPQPRIDWEKQMRYWTKQKLAAAYQRTEQSTLAQPLIEELAATKEDDIMSRNDLWLAGAVQAGSGARAIESKVLLDEGTRSNSTAYWIERIQYYIGRRESELVVQSLREALPKIPTDDKERFLRIFEYVYDYPLSQDKQVESLKSQISQILINEFNRAPLGSDLAFEIVKISSSEGFGLEDFNEALFIRRSDILTALFEKRPEWAGMRTFVSVLRDERLSTEQKKLYFAQLERLASSGSPSRKLVLAEVFKKVDENSRRIPLLLAYLRQVKANAENASSITNAVQSLFEAYTEAGNWQSAEKLLLERQSVFLSYWGYCLERLAISAARQNAVNDALRLWLKAANFNGHSRMGLVNLGETPAKPILCDYYMQMKAREPNSTIPDMALKTLRCLKPLNLNPGR